MFAQSSHSLPKTRPEEPKGAIAGSAVSIHTHSDRVRTTGNQLLTNMATRGCSALMSAANRAEVDQENSPALPVAVTPRSSKRKSAQLVSSRIRKQL